MNTAKKILVIVESGENGIKPFVFELIHAARLLANSLDGTVDALCLGLENSQADRLIHWGADHVRIFQNPRFRTISLDQALEAIEPQLTAEKPYAIFFFGNNSWKRTCGFFVRSIKCWFGHGLCCYRGRGARGTYGSTSGLRWAKLFPI